MTPPKESGLDSNPGSAQTSQGEETRDLFQELQKMRRDQQIRADTLRDTLLKPRSAAERMVDRHQPPAIESLENNEFVEGLDVGFALARNLKELKERAQSYVATNHVDKEGLDPALVDPADVGIRGHIVESDDGWFKPLPGDLRGQLVMDALERAKGRLDKRSMTEKARETIRRSASGVAEYARDVKKASMYEELEERAESEEFANRDKDFDDFDHEMDALRAKIKTDAETAAREAAEAKAAADAKARAEAEDAAESARILDDKTTEKYLADRVAEMRHPIEQKLNEVQRAQRDLDRLSLNPRLNKEVLRDRYIEEERLLRKEYEKVPEIVQEQVDIETERITNAVGDRIASLREFRSNPKKSKNIYEPGEGVNGEEAAFVAKAASELMHKEKTPFQVDEYELEHDDGSVTLMQRLVFKTDDESVVVVEDWDKSAGKLKRQAVLRGDDLIVSSAKAENLGRIKRTFRSKASKEKPVFNEARYTSKKLGLIKAKDVEADSGTDVATGHRNYTRRLARGGAAASSALELANAEYKPKKNKSFIAMLQESMTKGSK